MMQPLTMLAMNFGERAVYSLQMLLIGMGTIFGVLALLWGALEIFRAVIEKSKKESAAPAPVATPASAPAPVAKPEGDDALIAVITTAVAAAMAEENGGAVPAFRVVAFRKI